MLHHPSDIVLQKMFVQWVRDLKPTDEHECRDVLTTVGDLDQLAREVVDVEFEAVALSHLDDEKMAIVHLSLPTR